MISTENDDVSSFMKLVYFDHEMKTRVIGSTEYLNLAEADYWTLHRGCKWTSSKNDPASGFFIAHDEEYNQVGDGDDTTERRGDRSTYGRGRGVSGRRHG